jgi:murein DD-endopeptidase MepM/ murein hydrolase activator NlpD
MVYDSGGSFVRLKLFSKKMIVAAAALAVAGIILVGFVLGDYAYLKYDQYLSRDLRKEIRGLNVALKEKNKQITSFDLKIQALQLKLVKLNQLEQEIRSYTGIYNNLKNTGDYAVGGPSFDFDGEKVFTEEFYQNFLENINDNIQRLEEASGQQSEEFQILWETLKEIRAIQQVTPSLRPVDGGWISSKFGYRKSPFSGANEFHSGVDIVAHAGTPVVATADGTVTYAGYKGALGNTVEIDHGFGIVTRYGHLGKCRVKADKKIRRGEVIGKIGTSGRTTGAHLHYEIRLNDIPVNAEKYMSEYLAENDPS